jgi:ABC-type molybdate transport system substrate-binding protein
VAQDKELEIAKDDSRKADAVAADAQRRLDEAEQHRSAFWQHAEEQMKNLLTRVTQIQADVKDALAKSTETNQLVLAAANESKAAAGSAATEAIKAAGTAGAAKSAASRAAALSSHTSSVVATKVVTSQDKRSLNAQQAALTAKQQKLSQTIQRVKLKGPTVFEKLLHP